jgi:hypothetical protein
MLYRRRFGFKSHQRKKIPEERNRDLLHIVHTPFDQQDLQWQLVRCLHFKNRFFEAFTDILK